MRYWDLRVLETFGGEVNRCGGLELMEPGYKAELIAFIIMREQEHQRERLEAAAIGHA